MIEDIAKLGIVAADSPEALGGKGMSRVDVGSLMYELAVKDGSIATFWLLHDSLSTYTVMCFAQDDLRKKILVDTIPLKKVMAWALTEPDTGSDASHIQTTARKVEGGYLINGHKKWIGNATFADYILVWAKNQNDGGKVQCFLVRKGSKGLTTSKVERKMALRAVQNAHIELVDVFVPDDEKLQKAHDFRHTAQVLQHSRVSAAWMATGMAAGACEAAMKYCTERV